MKRTWLAPLLIILFASSTSRTLSQPIQNLVFEGGGIRGIAYAGVVEELEKAGFLANVRRTGGTSAGALIALTVSLGYSSAEIRKVVEDTNFSDFNDGQLLFAGGINRLSKNYGWYRVNRVDDWLGQIIRVKTKKEDITLLELHEHGFKDLYVTATCLNRQKLLVFSYQSYPQMKVKDAVRISMSIPLYFEASFIDSVGHVVKRSRHRENLDLVVDGGILGNFPIGLFDSTVMKDQQGRTRIPNPSTLGIRLDTDEQIEKDRTGGDLASMAINNLASYLTAFYVLIEENLNRNQLIPDDWKRTISISSLDVGPRIRKLSAAQKERLIRSGREGTLHYLKRGKTA